MNIPEWPAPYPGEIELSFPAAGRWPMFRILKLMKILIVDDNQQVRSLLRDHLPASASEVYECEDGDRALAMYQTYRPDWVLMDQDMPGIGGITAIRQIINQFPTARICMVTVFDDDELRSEAYKAGACGFVLKDQLFELEAVLSASTSIFTKDDA